MIQENVDFTEVRIAEIQKKLDAIQAQIDALMFEYCPDEMTKEQVDEWAKHQKLVTPERANLINKALGIKK